MKKKKIKHQNILEPNCRSPEQIADVVWLEKPKPKIEIKNKKQDVVGDEVRKSIKKRVIKKDS